MTAVDQARCREDRRSSLLGLLAIVGPMDVEPQALSAALEAVLSEHGPSTVLDLVRAPGVVEALRVFEVLGDADAPGPDAEEIVEDELCEAEFPAVQLTGERWAWGPDLLLGRTFTHRLTAREIEHDLLDINPDLSALLTLDELPEYSRLSDGAPLRVGFGFLLGASDDDPDDGDPDDDDPDDDDTGGSRPREAYDGFGSLELPPGALPGSATAGDLVGLRLTATGIELTAVDPDTVGDPAEAAQHLRRIVLATPEEPVTVEAAVLTVCAEASELFGNPLPPVADLIETAGLAHQGDFLAAADFDFRAVGLAARAGHLAQTYELEEGDAIDLLALVTLYRQFEDLVAAAKEAPEHGVDITAEARSRVHGDRGTADATPGPDSIGAVRDLIPLLARPDLAYAFFTEALGDQDEGAAALGLMAETLEERAERSVRPALRWLRARAHERLGDVLEAERALLAAERLDPDWPLTVLDLARYAADRSDADRGLSLLRRLESVPDPALAEMLQRFQPQPSPTRGRNEPCWCGSGRKFKQCHLHRVEPRPLEERAVWLYDKAARYVADGPWRPMLIAVAAERAAYATDEKEVRRRALDPIVTDAVLFEGGAFEEFVQVRGPLLPEDEQLLARQWLLVERSAFEVTGVARGRGFAVRDLRTGDHHDDVRDQTASGQLRVGMLICARVVPAGEQMQVFGGIEPVALHDRDALLEMLDRGADPDRLVAFCSRRFAPPSLVNTDGHPLAACDAVLSSDDPAGLAAILDVTFERVPGAEPPGWVQNRTIEGLERICASMISTGHGLEVSTNSKARMKEVLGVLRDLDPTLTLEAEACEPIQHPDEVTHVAERLPVPAGQPVAVDQGLDEVNDVIGGQIQAYEKAWLDLSLPALAGATPREAADDPTRRGDLLTLLASFPETDEPIQMSPARLRRALGLRD